jgi:cell division protease FtsH
MLFGGRVAEEMIFGDEKITTGAGNDIERATSIARRMVTQFGMSPVVGPIAVGDREQEIFLGRELSQRREVSERTAQLVDSEIKRIVDEAFAAARTVLENNTDLLTTIAEALLERETLDADEIKLLARGEALPPLRSASPVEALPEAADAEEAKPAASRPAQDTGGGEPSPALA